MGETVIEKIIRNNVGKTVKPGDIVTVNVDRVMIHDIFIPFVAEKFEEMGFTKLWNPEKFPPQLASVPVRHRSQMVKLHWSLIRKN